MSDPDSKVESVNSFVRGLAVIRCFGEGASRLTLSEVAKKAGLSRAGARRLLYTLCNENYVLTDGKQFWLTPRILDLGYSYLSSMEIWNFALEYLEKLREHVGESTSMSVLDGHDVVYVMRAQARRILTSHLGVGSRLPAHAISMGRIQLAALPLNELEGYLAEARLVAYTPYTVTDRDELRRLLLADRERGYSMVNRELELGISGIGMPIRDRFGRTIAAMSVNFHPERALEPGVIDNLLKHLEQTRNEIEDVLRMRG